MGLWDHEGLRYDSENWSSKWRNETPNWKEGTNITLQVEELAEEHKLGNGELFILTRKKLFEGCFYKGHSNSRKLNELVLILGLADMETG